MSNRKIEQTSDSKKQNYSPNSKISIKCANFPSD